MQSRYYNPTWGRFLNADSLVSTGQGLLGNNMFAYCRNNPVRRVDISGAADADCIDEDGELLSSEDLEAHNGGGVGVVSTRNSASSNTSHTSGTPIYRYGGTTPGKYVPSSNDVNTKSGLSFSTTPKPGSGQTTIEELNATGIVYAVQDGPRHVAVYPVVGSLEAWHRAGVLSPWTQAIFRVVHFDEG